MDVWKDALLKDPQNLFFALIGLFFLCYPLHTKWEQAKLSRRRTARTRGEVVDEETRFGTGAGVDFHRGDVPTRHPVVVFKVADVEYRVVSETGASWETLKRGQIVDVVYNPDNPQDAGLDHIALQAVEHFLLFFFPIIGAGMFLWSVVNVMRNLR